MTKHIHGGDVYKYDHCLDFSANCNPLGTPQSVKQAIIDSVEDLSDYPRVGCGPLKEAIADYEHTKKEYLICGNGAADLIFSLSRALNPKKALLPAPTFTERLAQSNGVARNIIARPYLVPLPAVDASSQACSRYYCTCLALS